MIAMCNVPTDSAGGGQHEPLAAHLALEGGEVGPELGDVLAAGAGAGEVPGVPGPITGEHCYDRPITGEHCYDPPITGEHCIVTILHQSELT